ncbi:MAG: hypothetical protein DRP29_01020 [Thermodesulfobacteriota bacterium]|nr:MAG: hypothetical protein DRP29_01020 [Thermodesulfobacteriota bacterium]
MSDNEIKSTLEIVWEKVEKIGKASKEELEIERLKEEAQKVVGKFLSQESSDFEKDFINLITDKPSKHRKVIIKTVVQTFLKNIVLPLTQYQLEDAKKAVQGLNIVFKTVPEVSQISRQIEKILEEYYNHKEILFNELKKRFNAGVEGLERALSNELGTEVKINVEEQPQFKEEWNKIKEKLDLEYGRQLEYLKNLFEKLIS